MSSTNKTPSLKLNAWIGTDVPCREDFVRDNNLIDDALSKHLSDTNIHITPQQRNVWTNYSFETSYVGNGQENQNVVLDCDFEPRFGYVYAQNYPTSRADFDNKTNYHYFGLFAQGVDTHGLSLQGKNLTVKNGSSTTFINEMNAFNDTGLSYQVVAFR